ncbi:MAG: hypothetical protein F6J89_13715 [Symploca sp. SIO1C4]|uniref:Uncharacterized protein n=1 Tax=Symploca sp. SIO1C4 TaxID=2607765 RepID=A0A6B3NDG1_9CYAN|nr:hypothetical protein [Symploca sp. SIO1C4]
MTAIDLMPVVLSLRRFYGQQLEDIPTYHLGLGLGYLVYDDHWSNQSETLEETNFWLFEKLSGLTPAEKETTAYFLEGMLLPRLWDNAEQL